MFIKNVMFTNRGVIMSKRKAKIKKKKYWIIAYAPELLGGVKRPLVKVLCTSPELLINRVILIKGYEITKRLEDRGMNLYFRIIKVTPSGAFTTLVGHDFVREILSSMVRRHMSKIEVITRVKTKDNQIVKTSVLAMTAHRCHYRQKRAIRLLFEEFLHNKAKNLTYEEYIYNIIMRKYDQEMINLAKKIYPIKEFLIFKTWAETVWVRPTEIPENIESPEEIIRNLEPFRVAK